jgi:uncharacterized surface protein with fasciclin (FAS1) repeats
MTIDKFTSSIRKFGILAGLIGASSLIGVPAIALTESSSEVNSVRENLVADQHDGGGYEAGASADANIVELASSKDSFNTLVEAVEAAELTDTLSGEGPYTVFAPTDEAFAQLPEGALEFLLQPENQDVLQRVLQYHVVSGEVTSDQLTTGEVETLSGAVAVEVNDEGVIVNNGSVIEADIEASNGVIHAVNQVLLPPDVQEALEAQLSSQYSE